MEKSSMFLEIFGSDDFIAPQKPMREPVTPLDDPLWSYLPGGNSADAEIERAQDADFMAKVTGFDLHEVKAATTSTPRFDNVAKPSDIVAKSARQSKRLEELNAKLEALISSEVSAALIPFRVEQIVETRRADLAKRAPMRKAAFNRMLSPLRELVRAKNPWDASSHVEALEHQRWNNYDDQRFERLTTAMENFVTNAIISEA
jgi:hypothetical protein